MVVYADVLVILNVFITYFILLCTKLMLRKSMYPKRKNIVIASLLGGFYALVLLIPSVHPIFLFLMNFIVSILLIMLSFTPKNMKNFLKAYLTFLLIHFLYIGITFIVLYYFQPKKIIFQHGFLYFDVHFKTLFIVTTLCYILLEILENLYRKRAPDNCYYVLNIFHHGNKYHAIGFLDTGHSLSDGFSDLPILVAEPKFFRTVTKVHLEEEFSKEKIRLIPYRDISTDGFLKAILVDEIQIPQKNLQVKPALLAESKHSFHSNDFEILFGNDLLEGGSIYEKK